MPATYEPIATTTLGSAAASISFTSIATSWTDLRLVLVGTGTSTSNAWLRFNNDSSALYSQTNLNGDGSTAGSTTQTSQTQIRQAYNLFDTTISMITYDVFSYAGSTFKTLLMEVCADKNGSGYVTRQVGLYRSTTAISRLDLVSSTSTFAAGTIATLYGIKSA
jgi:hypothetical protein